MTPNVVGNAIIRHSETGEEFSISRDELDWDCESEDRNMGAEHHYSATVSHPDLGDLTWSIWEYPEGVMNNTETDANGHVVVKDFGLSLDHEEDEPFA